MRRLTALTSSSRSSRVAVTADDAWSVVASGRLGPQWYADAVPWAVRGGIDRVLGGQGRAHHPPGRELLRVDDRVGFWRVLEADPEARRLRLVAEVRAPGRVELTTTVTADGSGCRVGQRVELQPSGLLGWAYLAVDLPAREVVAELAHRRLLRDLS